MSKIKSKETKPEIVVRKYLFSKGLRYRINDKRFVGKPDIVIPKYNSIVFVHGCFWHGHRGCDASRLPKTNKDFWRKKIQDNKLRDRNNIKQLESDEWNVFIIWDCEIKTISKRNKRLNRLYKDIIK
jgi:DNA mismatch endonuclease (patch repair protein)